MYRRDFSPLTWILLICATLLLVSCVPLGPAAPAASTGETENEPATSGSQMANPASENCIKQGGTLTIETRGDGGEFGVCTFEDNRQCEEWALFRAECPVGGVKVTGYATPAARYCAISGGEYQVDENATSGADQEQGTCTFPDGQSCDVWDYYNGICSETAESDDAGDDAANDAADASADVSAPADDSDPFTYCAAAGTEDNPAGESVDGEIPPAVVQGMIDQGIVSADAPVAIQQAALWRCMDGNVWVCAVGANLPCGEKADLSETPTQAMEEYCQANPDADGIPAAATGRATVYTWKCDGETPVVIEQVFTADAQGYLAEFWTELAPPE